MEDESYDDVCRDNVINFQTMLRKLRSKGQKQSENLSNYVLDIFRQKKAFYQ